MTYKTTEKGRAALGDGTFTVKDSKGRKSIAQRGRVVAAIAALEDAGVAPTKAEITKRALFRPKPSSTRTAAETKSNNVRFYLVALQDSGFIAAS